MTVKRLPLQTRFNAGLTEDAYSRLRSLNARWGLGYLLVVLLENLDRFADPERLDEAFADLIREYGAPDIRQD